MHSTMTLAVTASATFATADYIALTIYFALNIIIGWWCSRKNKSGGDYFLGGGRIPWWAAGISFSATGISSISFMALPAKTYTEDWLSFGSAPAQAFATAAVAIIFVGIFRRLNMTTIFDYLERRFDHRVRVLGAGLAVLLKVFGRMSVVMLLPALALSTVSGLNVYVSIGLMGLVTTIYALEGGFAAVIWTDVMQVAVMLGGVAIAFGSLAAGVPGGLAGIVDEALSDGKLRMVSWDFDFGKPTMWVFAGMFIASVFTQLADQPLMQRVFATKDEKEGRKSVLLAAVMGIPIAVIFFFAGTALYVFYKFHSARLAGGLPNDAIFPFFIVNEMPRGVVGLLLASLFAAAMGALGSALNATGAIVISDLYAPFRPTLSEKQKVRLGRLATLLAGLVSTGMAAWIASLEVASLWDQFLKLIALIGGGFPSVFALGLLTRRANAPGVITGALASIVITWWAQNHTTASVFFHGFIAISSCMAVGYFASLLFGGRNTAKNLQGLTMWDARAKKQNAKLPLKNSK
jgi:SSS family transporter